MPAMFDDPNEQPAERQVNPDDRAREKFDEFRMHAEFAAVFEGHRKFDAQIRPRLYPEIAREMQRTIAKLEKARAPDSPILLPPSADDAAGLLNLPQTRNLTTNDYHLYRRPGEVMILRWLEGDQVESFYERFQAHFDAALNQFREEERQQQGWKQDAQTLKYLEALDAISVKMADRYLRDIIRQHKLYVLSTQAADKLDILHLTDYVMGVSVDELVGEA